jgi:DNA-binding LytR/AlgR family response regulator
MEELDNKGLKSIVFKTPLGFDYFEYDEIVMIKADGNCSLIHVIDSDTPVRILHNLSFIEVHYCNENLIRCHKSYIINLMYIEKLLIKSRQVQMKMNLIVSLSENCVRKIRQISKVKLHQG